jgi:hypothetical protein
MARGRCGLNREELSSGPFGIRHTLLLWRFILADCRNYSLMNQQFTFAGWALALRVKDDGLHGGVDDMPLADWAGKRIVEKVQFDGAHDSKS